MSVVCRRFYPRGEFFPLVGNPWGVLRESKLAESCRLGSMGGFWRERLSLYIRILPTYFSIEVFLTQKFPILPQPHQQANFYSLAIPCVGNFALSWGIFSPRHPLTEANPLTLSTELLRISYPRDSSVSLKSFDFGGSWPVSLQ